MVRDVFGIESRIMIDPTSQRPMMLPIGRHHARLEQPVSGV
jgi:iron complex transport system ATP-binding protein